jgi:hypothetical protein
MISRDVAVAAEKTIGKPILDAIQRRAIAKWGEKKWRVKLVENYVIAAQMEGDIKENIIKRRPQIERALEVGSCKLETAMLLAEAVDCKFQLHCVEIEEF